MEHECASPMRRREMATSERGDDTGRETSKCERLLYGESISQTAILVLA